MATPSTKHPAMAAMLDSMTNRTEAITSDKCVNSPIGCGGPALSFRDELSAREYSISGLCQKCQDSLFGRST